MGILDILDPELFLKSCEEPSQEELLVGGGDPVPAAAPAAVGAPSVKLETLNELIHFDHIYTKPVEGLSGEQCGDLESSIDEKTDEASFLAEEQQQEVVVVVLEEEETTVCVKDEPEEVVIPACHGQAGDLFSGSPCKVLGALEKEACLGDTYSDSGYEGSPSPFSDMSSPLCSESWEDMFANELFPQLISVWIGPSAHKVLTKFQHTVHTHQS